MLHSSAPSHLIRPQWVPMAILLMLLGVPLYAVARNTHGPGVDEARTWWGDAMQGYVVEGCLHGTSGTTTVTIPACKAYALDTTTTPQLQYFEETGSRTVTLTAGDGTYWHGGRWNVSAIPGGWTCKDGTHYCWILSATAPAMPSGMLLLARSTVLGGAVTAAEPLLAHSPLDFVPLDASVYATQYGMTCDGSSDNSAALQAAHDALPSVGGRLILPTSALDCPFSRTFTITKSIALIGGGKLVAGGLAGVRPTTTNPHTSLRYTGSGTAIAVANNTTQGTLLQGFDLNHSGTADFGITFDNNSNMSTIRDVSIVNPAIPFAVAGIRGRTTFGMHTFTLDTVHLKETAPVNLSINGVVSYTKVMNSRITGASDVSLVIGDVVSSRHVEISHSDITNSLGGDSIRILRGEFVQIGPGNHMEQSGGGWNVNIPATAVVAENVRVIGNFMQCNAGCQGHVRVNFIGADLVVAYNSMLNNSGGTATFYVDNELARTTLVHYNKLVDTLIPTVRSLVRTYVLHNFRTNEVRGVLDGFGPVRLCTDSTIVGNVGAGEDTLYTCSIPAQTIFADNMGVRLRVWGRTGTTGNNKQVRVYIGGVLIWDTGVYTANANTWDVDCLGLRTASTAMRLVCRGVRDNTPTGVVVDFSGVVGAGWTVDQTITITGEGVANDDVQTRGLYVEALH